MLAQAAAAMGLVWILEPARWARRTAKEVVFLIVRHVHLVSLVKSNVTEAALRTDRPVLRVPAARSPVMGLAFLQARTVKDASLAKNPATELVFRFRSNVIMPATTI